jgi:hypothetical protein
LISLEIWVAISGSLAASGALRSMGMNLFYVTVFGDFFFRVRIGFFSGVFEGGLENVHFLCGVFVVKLWRIGWFSWTGDTTFSGG